MDIKERFVEAAPTAQHIVDLFKGEWSSRFPAATGISTEPGHATLFEDPRVEWAISRLGPLEGKSVLELGPLEGAHTVMIEKAGAKSVTAIESNTRAFLKCLCVKEIFRLQRTSFELGDFIKYLEERRGPNYDVLFASGVLYHMADPIHFLELITRASDRVFIWTHYYDREIISRRQDSDIFEPSALVGDGLRGSKRTYPSSATTWSGFSGGNEPYAIWLERASILQFLNRKGYQTEVAFEAPDHPNGPSFAISARRT